MMWVLSQQSHIINVSVSIHCFSPKLKTGLSLHEVERNWKSMFSCEEKYTELEPVFSKLEHVAWHASCYPLGRQKILGVKQWGKRCTCQNNQSHSGLTQPHDLARVVITCQSHLAAWWVLFILQWAAQFCVSKPMMWSLVPERIYFVPFKKYKFEPLLYVTFQGLY